MLNWLERLVDHFRQDAKWSCTAPFRLGLSTYNHYGSESTRLPQSEAGPLPAAVDQVTIVSKSTELLLGTVGTAEVAAASLLPQPAALIAMRLLLANVPAAVFTMANILVVALPLLMLTVDGDRLLWRAFVWFALPIALAELGIFLITMLLAYVPILQAHSGFLHGIKFLAMANSAGPFDTGYSGFGRRDCSQPHLAGLSHARNVKIRTADGETLGAWHVLPSGNVAMGAAAALEACSSAERGQTVSRRAPPTLTSVSSVSAAAAEVDEVYDRLLREASAGADGAGAVACIYLHGMGETRTKWVATEHAKLISSQLQLHVLLLDYRGFADSTGRPVETKRSLPLDWSRSGFGVDAEAALAWLGERGVPPWRVMVWGHSLGTGPATKLAYDLQQAQAQAQAPASLHDGRPGSPPQPLAALVLEAPYTSLLDACRTFPSGHLIRALPYGDRIMLRWFYFHFPILQMLATIQTPTLIFHGTDDVLVPFQHTAELAKAVAAEGRAGSSFTFVPLHGCGHLHAIFHPRFLGALATFFASLEGQSPRPTGSGAAEGGEHSGRE